MNEKIACFIYMSFKIKKKSRMSGKKWEKDSMFNFFKKEEDVFVLSLV